VRSDLCIKNAVPITCVLICGTLLLLFLKGNISLSGITGECVLFIWCFRIVSVYFLKN
jgi:hypothetical protein